MLVSDATWKAILAVSLVALAAGAIGVAYAIKERHDRWRIWTAGAVGALGLAVVVAAGLFSTHVYVCTERDGRVHVEERVDLATGGARARIDNRSDRVVRVETLEYGGPSDLDTRTVAIPPGKQHDLDGSLDYIGPRHVPPQTVRMRGNSAVKRWLTWDGGPESQAR